ncbi:carnitine acetyl transferase [Lyophyllum atratum]|nr:carnitine acetyl transferase [Lyophyllum atratum]
MAPSAPSGTLTFSADLPNLPVVDLHDTLARLKQTLFPIAWSSEEYTAVSQKIEDFAVGQGPRLQERLLKHATETRLWLEQAWDDDEYLGYRNSVSFKSIYYHHGFDAHPPHLSQTAAARAAGLARAAMLFRKNLRNGLLKPDTTKEGPLCMDSFRWMFECCRVPGPEGLDWGVSYAKDGDLGDSGHIIVFRNNRVWKLEAAQRGRILSTMEFERQVQYIYDQSTQDSYPGVGILTASHRDDCMTLASSPHNASIISAIESAAFVINLDASKPTTVVQHSRALWHGEVSNGVPVGLRNRWVDKPVQFIVFDNAHAGVMGEHSLMDGTITTRLCNEVLEMLHDPAFDHGVPAASVNCKPTPLDWEITPAIAEAITAADKAAVELIEGQELGYLLTPYGRAAIKNFGVSPDAWTQMIIQLAYRRLLGGKKRMGGTYEAATMRRFYKGRTEDIRVVTSESDAWAASMDDSRAGKGRRKELFMAATRKHVERAKDAGRGRGVGRHMFGLEAVLKEGEEIPALFNDPVFLRSSYWVLSTSAIFSKHFPVYGWGEDIPDGFSVAYMTGYDDRLQFTVTSRKEMPNARFCEEIARAARDLYELHEETACSGWKSARM